MRALLDGRGSTLFSLRWKAKATPVARRIFQLRASAPHTAASGSGSPRSGWPTATVQDSESSGSGQPRTSTHHSGLTLSDAARSSWGTPTATLLGNTLENYLAMKRNMTTRPRYSVTDLGMQAMLTEEADSGTDQTSSGSPAETVEPGRLNPAFSLWLMGYSDAWLWHAPDMRPEPRRKRRAGLTESGRSEVSATLSSPRSPQPSSERSETLLQVRAW